MAKTKPVATKTHAKKHTSAEGGTPSAADIAPAIAKAEKKERKPHRFRPGTVALREIKNLQKGTELLIPRAPFQRLVRETLQDFVDDYRISAEAFEALHQATEYYLVELLGDAYYASLHKQHVTIDPKDLKLAQRLRGERFSR